MNRRNFFASIPLLAAVMKMLGGEKRGQPWPPDIDTMTARYIAGPRGIVTEENVEYFSGIHRNPGFYD